MAVKFLDNLLSLFGWDHRVDRVILWNGSQLAARWLLGRDAGWLFARVANFCANCFKVRSEKMVSS
jgi:hypothetical protein